MGAKFEHSLLGILLCLAVSESMSTARAAGASGAASATIVHAVDVEERTEAIRLPSLQLWLEFDATAELEAGAPVVLNEVIGKYCSGVSAPIYSHGRLNSDPANRRVSPSIMVERVRDVR